MMVVVMSAGAVYADGMSVYTFKKLETIETMIADGQMANAETRLKSLLSNLPRQREDQAYIHYTAAMFYLRKDRLDLAETYLKKAHDPTIFPEKTTRYILSTLAGISMQKERYADAIGYYKQCLSPDSEPDPDICLGLGTACYQIKDYPAAVKALTRIHNPSAPNEHVCLMLFSCYHDMSRTDEAARVLETMVREWPSKKQYWLQLFSVYLDRKDRTKALAVMESALAFGLSLTENDHLQYVSMLYEAGLPFKAASVLKKSIDNKIVKSNLGNLELLATLYQESRERKESIRVLEKAAALSVDGRQDLYIAQLYYDMGSHEEAKVIEHAQAALRKGIKEPKHAHMLIAAAQSDMDDGKKDPQFLATASEKKEAKKVSGQRHESMN